MMQPRIDNPRLEPHIAPMRHGIPYHRATKLQDLIYSTCHKESVKPIELAQLARAWDSLENRKRILKMKGLPKPVDAPKAKTAADVVIAPRE